MCKILHTYVNRIKIYAKNTQILCKIYTTTKNTTKTTTKVVVKIKNNIITLLV